MSALTGWTRWRVFVRSLFLQASWNPKGMQNLGIAYALYPALKKLYPEPGAQSAAVRRHLVFFNTHPYVAAAILGGILFHEERLARGEGSVERVTAFKAALMGPLAALGDGFFWLSLRPAVGALCAALVPLLGAWAALLFLLLYNAVHLSLRAWLFFLGMKMGDELVAGQVGGVEPDADHRRRRDHRDQRRLERNVQVLQQPERGAGVGDMGEVHEPRNDCLARVERQLRTDHRLAGLIQDDDHDRQEDLETPRLTRWRVAPGHPGSARRCRPRPDRSRQTSPRASSART